MSQTADEKPEEKAPESKPAYSPAPMFHYKWITNEDLLRDEAILAAFTRSHPEPYIELIRGYFSIQKSPLEAEKDSLEKRTQVFQTELAERRAMLEQLEKEVFASWPEVEKSQHAFFRKAIGAVGYTGLILVNIVLAWWWISPIQEGAFAIALGGYLTGLFTLFHRQSFLLTSDEERFPQGKPQPERWKVWLEEIGTPVIATLLIVGMGWQYHTPYLGIIVGLFLLFLFLFGGKSFLSLWASLPDEYRQMRNNRRKVAMDRKNHHLREEKIQPLVAQIAESADNLQRLESDRLRLFKELRKMDAETEAVIRYFMTEYTLAEGTMKQFGKDLLVLLKTVDNHA